MIKTFEEVGKNDILMSFDISGLENALVWRYWENREERTVEEEYSMVVLYKRINHKLHSYALRIPYKHIDNEKFLFSMIEAHKDNSYFRDQEK